MTSKKSSSKNAIFAVFRTQLYQLRMLIGLFGFILLAFSVFLTLGMFSGSYWDSWNMSLRNDVIFQLMGNVWTGGLIFMMILGVCLAIGEFGYLHKRQKLDYFHALPVSRTEHFVGRVLAALVALAIGAALVGVGQSFGIAMTLKEHFTEILGAIWTSCALLILPAFVAYLFTTLMVVLTATLWEMVFSTVIVTAAYPFLMLLTVMLINVSVPISNFDPDWYDATLFSPLLTGIGLFFESNYNQMLSSVMVPVIILLVQMLICGVSAFFIFRRRCSELAESNTATYFKFLVRFLTAAQASAIGSMIFLWILNSYWGYLVGSVFGFVAAWLIMELLYTHSVRGALRCLVPNVAGYGVFAVLNLLVAFGFIGIPHLPNLDEIDAVTVMYSKYSDDVNVSGCGGEMRTVYTDLDPREVRMASFDDATVEEGYAMAQTMLKLQNETYFPYYPRTSFSVNSWRDEFNNGNQAVEVSLYSNKEEIRIDYRDTLENEVLNDLYARAKKVVNTPEYLKSNPVLAFLEIANRVEVYGSTGYSEYSLKSFSDYDAIVERLKEAYLKDMQNENLPGDSENLHVDEKEYVEQYTIYLTADPITLHGGIIDEQYPAEGLKCWNDPTYTPAYTGELSDEEKEGAAYSTTLYIDSNDSPNTFKVLDELYERSKAMTK